MFQAMTTLTSLLLVDIPIRMMTILSYQAIGAIGILSLLGICVRLLIRMKKLGNACLGNSRGTIYCHGGMPNRIRGNRTLWITKMCPISLQLLNGLDNSFRNQLKLEMDLY